MLLLLPDYNRVSVNRMSESLSDYIHKKKKTKKKNKILLKYNSSGVVTYAKFSVTIDEHKLQFKQYSINP